MGICRVLSALACLLPALAAWAQSDLTRPEDHPGGVLLVVTDRSGLVTNDSPLYLASNRVGWNPGDPSMKLSGRSDLRWQIQLPGPIGEPSLAFKFTRGSWDTVEVASDLQDIANRTLAPADLSGLSPDKPVVIELAVERFADERAGAGGLRPDAERTLRVTGKVVRVQVIGGAGAAAGAMREVLVWLPPGYDDPANAGRRYPVLYMQDGQNVFDFRPPTPGEWRADETATELIEAREIEPVIIAAVPHSGRNRMVEYMPGRLDPAVEVGPGGAERYIDWLVREVVPRVERAVRADPNPTRRGIGGSSLGGLVALRAGEMYPGVFGCLLVESPSLRLGGQWVMPEGLGGVGGRVFLGFGGSELGDDDESSRYMQLCYKVGSFLTGVQGPDGKDRVAIVCDPEAQHNEAAWAGRFGGALRHLYPTVAR